MKVILWLFLITFVLLIGVGAAYLLIVLNDTSETPGGTLPSMVEQMVPSYKFIYASCPHCNSNPLDIEECTLFLEELKNYPPFTSLASQSEVDISNINKIEKKVTLNSKSGKEIRCFYYSPA